MFSPAENLPSSAPAAPPPQAQDEHPERKPMSETLTTETMTTTQLHDTMHVLRMRMALAIEIHHQQLIRDLADQLCEAGDEMARRLERLEN
jgi:hypothetical protein